MDKNYTSVLDDKFRDYIKTRSIGLFEAYIYPWVKSSAKLLAISKENKGVSRLDKIGFTEQDLISEIYLKLIERGDKIIEAKSPTNYLYRSMLNFLKDEAKKLEGKEQKYLKMMDIVEKKGLIDEDGSI